MSSLQRLEAFVRSAERSSFSAAARALSLTPAAVSKSVALLEEELGVRLFHRTTRSLRLTEPGERLLHEVAGGLSTIQSAIEGARGATAPAGTLRVSMELAFGRALVLPVVPAFLERYPQVSLDWSFENRQVDLAGEGFDAAIGAGFELSPGVVAHELARAHIVAVASPAYLARTRAPRQPADLAAHDGVLMRSATSGRLLAFRFRGPGGAEAPFEPRPRLVFTDQAAMCDATLQGLGIGLLSMPHTVEHLESGALVRVLPRWHADAGPISLYFMGRQLPAKTRAFVDHVVAAFRRDRVADRLRAG